MAVEKRADGRATSLVRLGRVSLRSPALGSALEFWSKPMTIFAMNTIRLSIGKAKPALCELVDRAGEGQTSIITVHGKPKAQIGPIPAETAPAKALTEAWRKRVKHIRLNQPGRKKVSLHELIAQGRK